jgi:hypothetical protein
MTVLASGAEELEDQPHAPALVGGPDLRGQISEAEQARIGRQRHAEHMARRADDPIENRQARLARAGLVDRDGGLAGTRRPRQLALGQPCRAAACFNDVRRLRRTTPGTRSTIEGLSRRSGASLKDHERRCLGGSSEPGEAGVLDHPSGWTYPPGRRPATWTAGTAPIVLAVVARHLGVEPFTRQPGVAAGGRCELVGGLGTADGQRPVPALR